MSEYVHPEVLVTASWAANNLNNPNVRFIEADEDVLLYEVRNPLVGSHDW